MARCMTCRPNQFDVGYSRNPRPSLGIPGIGVLTSHYGATGLAVLVNRRRGYGADTGGTKGGVQIADSTGTKKPPAGTKKLPAGTEVAIEVADPSKPSAGEVLLGLADKGSDMVKTIFGRQPDAPAFDPTVVDPNDKKPLPTWVGPVVAASAVALLIGGAFALRK